MSNMLQSWLAKLDNDFAYRPIDILVLKLYHNAPSVVATHFLSMAFKLQSHVCQTGVERGQSI